MILPALLLSLAQTAAPAPAATPTPGATPAPQAGAASTDQLRPPAAFITASQAFGQCIGTGAGAVPATTTPEAGAKQVVAGCATQRATLDREFEAWVSGPGFPEAGRATARSQYGAQLSGVEGQLAEGLRNARAGAAAPAAAPTPAPAATATPAPKR